MNNDNIRAGLITISKGIVPILLLLGIWKPDDTSAVGGLLVAIELVVTGFFLAIKKQPAAAPSTFAPVVVGLLLTLGAMLAMTGSSPASAQEPPSTIEQGSFRIVQDTNPENDLARFRFEVYRGGEELADFWLYDDDERLFELMEPGVYTVRQRALDGYDGPKVTCTNVDEDDLANGVRFELEPGASIRCIFTNEPTPEPTATPTATAAPTKTPAPAPTQRPAEWARCADGTFVNLADGDNCTPATPVPPAPTAAPPPVVVAPPASVGIRPPSTGSAGLLE